MAFENVQIVAGGRVFEGWESVRVTLGRGDTVPEFEVAVAETGGASPFDTWPLLPGTPVTVHAGGSLLITGYVTEYAPSASAQEHSVRVSGASRSVDIVDSSPFHPTGTFENRTLLEIASELASPFGVAVRASAGAAGLVDLFQIRRGSTVWAELIRLAQGHGMTLTGLPDGSVEIGRAPAGRHAGQLRQGLNIERMSARMTDRYRFSRTDVIGQSADGDDEQNLQPLGIAIDPGIRRFRYKETSDQAATTPARAQTEAEWLKRRAFAFSVRAEIVTPAWRDSSGSLWRAGALVFVDAPWLHIAQDMMIDEITFTQDDRSGTLAALSLVDPGADGFSPLTVTGSEKWWRMDIPSDRDNRRNE